MTTTNLEARIRQAAQDRAQAECGLFRAKLEAFTSHYGIRPQIRLSVGSTTPTLFEATNALLSLVIEHATEYHENAILNRLLDHATNEKGDEVPF